MRKKILIIVCILVILGIGGLVYFHMNNTPEKKLMNVLDGKQIFIDYDGAKVTLEDYQIAYEHIEINSYTLVNLDDDDIKEIIAKTTSTQGAYVIFRYDDTTKNIYAYSVNSQALTDIKEDGSVRGSTEVGANIYLKFIFDETEITHEEVAHLDVINNEHKIDGKKVTQDEINDYIEDFEAKKDAKWIKYKK